MAVFELARTLNCVVRVASGVPAALYCRFAVWDTAQIGVGSDAYEVKTHVPAATGAPAQGVLAQRISQNELSANGGNGVYASQIAIPEGGQCLIELGEAVTAYGQPLRVGGNSTEVDGAAYLANATGDIIVGYALVATGAVGEIIPFQFVGYHGAAA
jgi:hypothetical protein